VLYSVHLGWARASHHHQTHSQSPLLSLEVILQCTREMPPTGHHHNCLIAPPLGRQAAERSYNNWKPHPLPGSEGRNVSVLWQTSLGPYKMQQKHFELPTPGLMRVVSLKDKVQAGPPIAHA
jgi:hypothetical protein